MNARSPSNQLELELGLKPRLKMGLWRISPALLERLQKRAAQEFSIAVYAGDSIENLQPVSVVGQPVLTKTDVTDVPAAFVADPFIHYANGRWYMFFEVLHAAFRRGLIALATSEDGLTWRYDRVVLREPFHLSYPYVFEHEGAHYMIPETGRARSVRLYRAEEFPYRWRPIRTLLDDSNFVDPSVCVVDGLWWMWTGSSVGNDRLALRLFFAESPLGPWQEHPASPVVNGASGLARPAGRVFADSGRLLRFAQSDYPEYGSRVHAIEIRELTPERYTEELVIADLLGPGDHEWNRDGMHHIDLARLPDGRLLASVDGWKKNPR